MVEVDPEDVDGLEAAEEMPVTAAKAAPEARPPIRTRLVAREGYRLGRVGFLALSSTWPTLRPLGECQLNER